MKLSRRRATKVFPDPLRDFWDDWDYRQEKLTGVPPPMMAPGPMGMAA